MVLLDPEEYEARSKLLSRQLAVFFREHLHDLDPDQALELTAQIAGTLLLSAQRVLDIRRGEPDEKESA